MVLVCHRFRDGAALGGLINGGRVLRDGIFVHSDVLGRGHACGALRRASSMGMSRGRGALREWGCAESGGAVERDEIAFFADAGEENDQVAQRGDWLLEAAGENAEAVHVVLVNAAVVVEGLADRQTCFLQVHFFEAIASQGILWEAFN